MILFLATASIASGAFLFLWGWFFAVIVFKKSQAQHFDAISRPAAEINVGAIAVEKVVQGLLLALVYVHLRPWTDLGWLNGLLFGALVGALLEAAYFFTTWINYRVPAVLVLTRAVAGWFRLVLAGCLIGWLAGLFAI